MIRKVTIAVIAIAAFALISVAFLAGIILGLGYCLSKATQHPPIATIQTPIENPPSVDLWMEPITASKRPQWVSMGTLQTITATPTLTGTIAPLLLPPASDVIAPSPTSPSETISLEVVNDPWVTPSEPVEPSCTPRRVSVSFPPYQPLLAPCKPTKSKGKKPKPPSPTNDLSTLSREALKQRCRELKIPRYSALKKVEMVAAIIAATT
jgi:hypothetical protein